MNCAICAKRPAKRWCPAKGAKICTVCCGTEREVTIDCPSDCRYLIEARRQEREHRKPLPAQEVPFADLGIDPGLVREQRGIISGLGFTIVRFAQENPSARDADVLAALKALAETYRTLGSGLYYERPPEDRVQAALYADLAKFIEQARKAEAERTGVTTLKDGEVFPLLVFLLRVGRHETNGRPKSWAFLDALRAQFKGISELEKKEDAARIIVP